jgi:hypothetical protein
MSTAARKARKRAGVQFTHPTKVGTPIEDRALPVVRKYVRGAWITGTSNRAAAKAQRVLKALRGDR